MTNYDVTVIGSGPGGYVAAIRCAQLGLKTCCIEKESTLGGTCLNVGCIPSKSLLYSTELYYKVLKQGAEQGISYQKLSYDFAQMMKRKENVVQSFTKGIEGLFKKNKIDWMQGTASLKDSHTILVNDQTIHSKYIILATGSVPIALPFLPFDETKVLSSTGALALQKPPKKLLVVGAGVIGVELGSVYQRLGSEVVFIEFLDRICPAFDGALSKALLKSLTSQGMQFHLSHKVLSAEIKDHVHLKVQTPTEEKTFSADAVLVSVGRKPFSDGLNLERLSIQKDAKGYVQINSSFQTSEPHIFAIGDLIDGPMLAHKASEEGIAVAGFKISNPNVKSSCGCGTSHGY